MSRLTTTRVIAALALWGLPACGAPQSDEVAARPDPAVTFAPNAEAIFPAPGLPVGDDGAPLRAAAVEGEWTTHRGNTLRTGTRLAPGIGRPTISWSARVGIQGYLNTPLVTRDTVYVSSQGQEHDVADADDGFYALDAATGGRRWFTATNEDINGSSLTDDLVVGGSDDGTLYAVERTSGNLRWSVELGYPLRHGPLAVGNRLYVVAAEGLDVLEADSGRLIERVGAGSDGYDLRGGLAADGDEFYRVGNACDLSAAADRGEGWERTICTNDAGWGPSYTTPVIVGGAVLVVGADRVGYESGDLTIGLYQRDDGARIWSGAASEVSSALGMRTGGLAYESHYSAGVPWVMNGIAWLPMVTAPHVAGYGLATGSLTASIALPNCRNRQFASIVGVPSRGYFARHDGSLYAFSPATGEIAWVMALQYNASAGVASVSTAAPLQTYYGSDYCSGDPYDGSALFSTPAIGEDGTLFVGSGEGFVYAIRDTAWMQ